MHNEISDEIKAIITEAVNAGIRAGRAQAITSAKDPYRATEKRLYALPILEGKNTNDKTVLKELTTNGSQKRGKSIVRFSRSGYRVSPEEMLEGIVRDLCATMAADEHEIVTVRCALEVISADKYYITVTGKYMENKSDEEIAEEIICDSSTVWRNRKRLVQRLAVWLYGAAAI